MEWYNLIIIFATGLFAGFINTIAGGGSLIALPMLIFLGLPSTVANATNRVAIFFQNIFGVAGFKSKGISSWPFSLHIGLFALIGAVIGARFAIDIRGEVFNKILAIVMIVVVLITIYKPKAKPKDKNDNDGIGQKILSYVSFFLIGIYGGFIQAGVGFLIISSLTFVNRFSLVQANATKVMVILIYTSAALLVFMLEGKIDWTAGLVLAAGNSSGAWFGSRWSVDKGDKWIKRILVIMVITLAIKLWFF